MANIDDLLLDAMEAELGLKPAPVQLTANAEPAWVAAYETWAWKFTKMVGRVLGIVLLLPVIIGFGALAGFLLVLAWKLLLMAFS